MGKGQKNLRDNVIWGAIREAVQETAKPTAVKQEYPGSLINRYI